MLRPGAAPSDPPRYATTSQLKSFYSYNYGGQNKENVSRTGLVIIDLLSEEFGVHVARVTCLLGKYMPSNIMAVSAVECAKVQNFVSF